MLCAGGGGEEGGEGGEEENVKDLKRKNRKEKERKKPVKQPRVPGSNPNEDIFLCLFFLIWQAPQIIHPLDHFFSSQPSFFFFFFFFLFTMDTTSRNKPNPPTKIPISKVQKVSESCFDYLNIEMVDYILSTSKESREDVFLKLERMGFIVGQRLAFR